MWTLINLSSDITENNFTLKPGKLTKIIVINLINKQTLIKFFVEKI